MGNPELRLDPDLVRALFDMARGFLGTSGGNIAMQQMALPLPETTGRQPRLKRNVIAA